MRFKFVWALIAMISAATYGLRSPAFRRASFLRPMLASTLATPIKDRQFAHHPAYRKVDEFYVQEYGFKGAMFEHQKSGAQVLSIIAPDDNKVFGINFRTPPSDSTGLPHVLEHSVLCGSRKFPVKEPFVDMLKGSLQNFLNAFTYPDRTCYPIASVNTKDFYNLIHIYLDAVLHPRALHDPQVLQQEGWHYELQNPSDDLSIKGVVYNEMKGVYSSPDSLLARATEHALFPDTTYGLDSGGDPAKIPDLTFGQFQAFHRKYYHPSNSRIFFYGDDDPYQRLVLLDEYLRDFSRQPVDSSIPFQRKRQQLLDKVTVPYPVSPGRPLTHILTVNWLLNDHPLTPLEQLTLSVLNHLLLGTRTSALYKALAESQLGESVTGGGISSELLQATFHVGLKGVRPEHTSQVETLILSTLQSLAGTGFEASAIEASLNTLEFMLREFNTGDYPRGLSVMLSMLAPWNYDRSPVEGVQFEQPLAELKQAIQQGKPVFQDAIQRLLLKNVHRVTVEMVPDVHLEEQSQHEEARRLEDIKNNFSPAQIEEIVQSTQALREAQERPDSPEARATLPTLTLEDIPPHVTDLPLAVESDGLAGAPSTVLTHSLPTSGILYAQVLLDFSHVALEDVPYLPLFIRMLKEAGTEQRDATSLAREIGIHTGGITVGLMHDHNAVDRVAEPHDAMLYLTLQGKAVYDKIPRLVSLMHEILHSAKLDSSSRAVELLREMKAKKESSLLTSGHSIAGTRLAAQQSGLVGYLREQMYGLTSIRQAASLLDQAETQWGDVHAHLENIRQTILRKTPRRNTRSLVINLTGEDAGLAIGLREMQPLIASLTAADDSEEKMRSSSSSRPSLQELWKTSSSQLQLPRRHEAFAIPSLVNMVVQAGSLYPSGEKVSGSFSVLTRLLSTGYLWDTVRVLGGAYGGSAGFNPSTGRLAFQSYRDPNLLATIQAYQQSVEALEEQAQQIDDQTIRQAVIGTVGDLDSPLSVDQKGHVSMMRFLMNWTPEVRQTWRNQVLQTSKKDVEEFIQRLRPVAKEGQVVVFGSQQAIDKANQELPPEKRLAVELALPSLTGDAQDEEGGEHE